MNTKYVIQCDENMPNERNYYSGHDPHTGRIYADTLTNCRKWNTYSECKDWKESFQIPGKMLLLEGLTMTPIINDQVIEFLHRNNLELVANFVPWSQSRNRKDKPNLSDYSLNWKVSIHRKGRTLLETDYHAGIGHCKSYRQGMKSTLHNVEIIAKECEGKGILPECDTISALWFIVSDSDVINFASFESWAESLGYDTDSRKAYQTYQDCLKTALILRSVIGEKGMTELREIYQDY